MSHSVRPLLAGLLALLAGIFGSSIAARDVAAADPVSREELAAAHHVLEPLTPAQCAAASTIRRLVARQEDWSRLQEWCQPRALSPLGDTPVPEKGSLPDWAKLRLVALLRAGYPSDLALTRELASYLGSAASTTNLSACSLELLLIDELLARSDDELASERKRALERLEVVARAVPWPLPSATSSPQFEPLFQEALCRSALRRNSREAPSPASKTLATLLEPAKKENQEKGTRIPRSL